MATEKQRKSKKQEMRITKSFREIKEEAKRMMASGALWFAKSDVVTKRFRVECKTKEQPTKSITVKKEWFEKIQREAFESNKVGILAFSFGDGEDFVAMRIEDFIELISQRPTTS